MFECDNIFKPEVTAEFSSHQVKRFPQEACNAISLSGPSQHVPPEPVHRVPEELGPVPAAAWDGAQVHRQPAAGPVPARAPATDPQSPHVMTGMEWLQLVLFMSFYIIELINMKTI